MKRYILITIFLSLINITAQAKPIIIYDESIPVTNKAWEATLNDGGFKIINNTSKKLLIQIKIDRGVIGVYSQGNSTLNCNLDLTAEDQPQIGLCELEPRSDLNIDLDYVWASSHYPIAAIGTYNISALLN